MRKLMPITIVIAIAGALTASVAASTAATGGATTKITCRWTSYNPAPTRASGIVIGFMKCSQPLGKGVISATYTSTFNSTTGAGTAAGTWMKWLLNGTAHGRYSNTFQFTSNSDARYKATVAWTGGTGAYRGVKGTGSESCSTTDGGATESCTAVDEVTGL